MTLHASRLTPFDLETTSPDPLLARIVTAAVCGVGGGHPATARGWMIRPEGYEIPAESTAIHGITHEHALAEGVDGLTAIGQIVEELASSLRAGIPVLGHNIGAYDLTVLHCEALRYGVPTLSERVAELRPIIDTCTLDRRIDKYRKTPPGGEGRHTLVTSAREHGVEFDPQSAHGAEYDAMVAGRVFWKMAAVAEGAIPPPDWAGLRSTRFSDLRGLDFDALHDAQARWHAAWAADIYPWIVKAWARERDEKLAAGEPFDKPEPSPIDPSWPLCSRPLPAEGAS